MKFQFLVRPFILILINVNLEITKKSFFQIFGSPILLRNNLVIFIKPSRIYINVYVREKGGGKRGL